MKRLMLLRLFLIFLPSLLFLEEVDLTVTIQAGANLSFTDFNLSESDFELQGNGDHVFSRESTWFYASNESQGSYKLKGKLLQTLDGWVVESALSPPENAKDGIFGIAANGGNPIAFSTFDQDFVTSIKKGKIGDLQTQTLIITATHEGFVNQAGFPFNFIIEWTLEGE